MVEIENLKLFYPSGENVLNGVSLKIGDGECVLLTGESGSGKSSIINSLNGLSTRYYGCEYSGTIKIYGQDTKDMELWEISTLVSSVFQNPKTHFFNVDTTLELLFFLENIGASKEEMDRRLNEMLEVFPIEHLLDRDIFKLSGGEKQILCVAASYISGAKYIVLDEPSSNLDARFTNILKDMLTILKKRGVSILIAEHRIYYLMDIVDRVMLIKNGVVAMELSTNETLSMDSAKLSSLGLRSTRGEELKINELDTEGELEIRSLTYFFKEKDRGIKVKNVFLKKGKIYGIVGNNGCGKSTFMRALIGLEPRAKDEIYFLDKRLKKKDRLKMSGLVMQDVNHQLFTDSVESELELGIKNVDKKHIDYVLKSLNLNDFRERHPMSLSGGQKQRVAIASVLSKNSQILCFDEPTSGMDYLNMARISKLIKSCIDEDKIILIISHDIEFLNVTVDYILDMEKFAYNNIK